MPSSGLERKDFTRSGTGVCRPMMGALRWGKSPLDAACQQQSRATMCLAVPGKILSIVNDDGVMRTGRVSFGGIVKEVNLAYTPDATVGDYVIVHVGFAISTVDEREAERVFAYLQELDNLEEDLDDALY
jgi:hydrogenase expression/formation protein HypC